jgi:phage terminase large subunit-like protein
MPLVERGRGFVSMSPAVQRFVAAVLDKHIQHGGHPILRWQVSNVAIETDAAGNRKPSKRRATGHIDGVAAAMLAIATAGDMTPVIDVTAMIA